MFSRLPGGVPGPGPRLDPGPTRVACVPAHSRRRYVRFGRLDAVDFNSAYDQGFARVAACTVPVVDRRPRDQRRRPCSPRHARATTDGVAVAVFPELSPDRLLDRGPAAAGRAARRRSRPRSTNSSPSVGPAAGARRRRTAAARQPGLQLRRRRPPRPRARGRRRSPTCRPTGSSTSAATSRPATTGAGRRSGSAGARCRSGPTCSSGPPTCPGLVLHVEVCEDMWVPVPPSAEAALAGATVLVNLSGSPITVGRAEDRRLLVRSASQRCLAAYVYAAGRRGRVHHRPVVGRADDDLRARRAARGDRAVPRRRRGARWPTSTSTSCARSGCGRARSTTTAALTSRPGRAFRTVEFALDPPTGDIGLRRQRRPLPVRARRPGPARPGLLRGLQHPGRRARAAAPGDRQPQGRHRRLRRPRLHPRADRRGQGDGPARPPAQRHPRASRCRASRPATPPKANAHPAGAQALGVTFEEIDIRPAARQMLEDIGHPFAEGEPVYDVTFENVQAGLRTDYLFRIANQRGGIVLGTGDLSELALGWCTYGVGDQMSHYAVNAGVPEDADPAPDPLGGLRGDQFDDEVNEVLRRSSSTRRSSPELVPVEEVSRAEHRGRDRALRPAGLHALPRAALRLPAEPDRVPRRARLGATSTRGSGRPASDEARGRRTTWPTIRQWLEVFVKRFFAFSQFKRVGAAQRPEGGPPAARCRRAATGARRPTATPRSGSTSSSATSRRADPPARRGASTGAKHGQVRLWPDHRPSDIQEGP